MKSNQNQSSYQTNCKDCVFAEYEGITQVSCQADRLKFFGDTVEAYDNDKEFYVINDVCTYYRPPSWNDGKPDKSKAREELKPTFGIYVNISNQDDESVAKTVDSIKLIDYEKERIVITINHLLEEEKPYYHEVLGSLLNHGFNAFLTVARLKIHKEWDNIQRLQGTDFCSFVNAGEEVEPNIFTACEREKAESGDKFVSLTLGGTDLFMTNIFTRYYLQHLDIPELKDALLKESMEEGHHKDLNG